MYMSTILSGKEVAAALTDTLVQRTRVLKERGISPALAIVRVGEREDDLSYERGATKRCEKIGVAVRSFRLPGGAAPGHRPGQPGPVHPWLPALPSIAQTDG